MVQASLEDVTEYPTHLAREPPGHLRACLLIEGTAGIQEIRAVKHPPDHVPLGEPDGVITHGVEDAAIRLAFGLGPCRSGRAVPQHHRTGGAGRPLFQLLIHRVPHRIVQPCGSEPSVALVVRYPQLLGPGYEEARNPLDMLQALVRYACP